MTTRNDFYAFRMLIQELEQKTSQYNVLQEKLKAPSASFLSGMPKNLNPTNRLEYLLNKRMDLSKKIDKLKVQISQERLKLEESMQCLNVSERTVLESRYFLLYTWSEITTIIFEAFPDIKENMDDYVQKTRIIQTRAFKKLEKRTNEIRVK